MSGPKPKEPICTVTIKGTVTKEQLYPILEMVDDMKKRGYKMETHDRDDYVIDQTYIYYQLKLYRK